MEEAVTGLAVDRPSHSAEQRLNQLGEVLGGPAKPAPQRRAARYFSQRAAPASLPKALRILKRAGTGNPRIKGDELPSKGGGDNWAAASLVPASSIVRKFMRSVAALTAGRHFEVGQICRGATM
jgi:hypothetical protein